MDVTQGYIIGYPAVAGLDRQSSKSAPSLRHQVGLNGEPPVDPTMVGMSLPPFGGRFSLAGWLLAYGAGLRTIVRLMPKLRTVQITYRSGMSFFDQVVPVLLLGRFFGTRTTLSYISNKAEIELEDFGQAYIPFLRLCHRIEVGCSYTQSIFHGHGLAAEVASPLVDRTLFAPRLVSEVQPNIVITRRLERGNGLLLALRAFQLVKLKYPRAELSVIGDGPQRRQLEEWVRQERIFGVTFTGPVPHHDVARRMAVADVYLNAATLDGLPVSLLEALACGLPIVTTDAGGISAVIKDRYNGLIAPINNYPALADRIIELVEQPGLTASLSQAAGNSATAFLINSQAQPFSAAG